MSSPPTLALFVSFLFLSLHLSSSNPSNVDNHEAFIQCFNDHIPHSDTPTTAILHLSNTSSYATIFRSTVQNLRFLSSATAKPAFVVTPTNATHVQAAVTCGRAHGIRLLTRSGGHDYEGQSYTSSGADPFLVLDLANLRSVQIDAKAGTAWVGAGATVGEVYYHIANTNNTAAFPAGIYPTIGVGGLFTGGGIGALMRKYGVSADNIVNAMLVDVNGNLLDRSTMGDDLFWAIRGGGGASFGVIVAFKIKLVYVPPTVTTFSITRNLSQGATRLIERWQHVGPALDDDVFIRILVFAKNQTIDAVFQCLFLGPSNELLPIMEKSFPELGVEAKDLKESSWIESAVRFAGIANESLLLDRRPQYNSSFKAKSDFVKEPISEKGLEKILKFILRAEDQPVVMIMDAWGGKLDEIGEDEIAFPHRKGNLYNIQHFMRWFEEEEEVTQKHLDWMRSFYSFMEPYVSKNPRAAYLNYKDLDLGRNGGVKNCGPLSGASEFGEKYFLGNFERLVAVKARVDPDNYFQNEQSIPPFLA